MVSTLPSASSKANFNEFLQTSGTNLVVAHFYADWAPQCAQVTDVLNELSRDGTLSSVRFVQVEAENVPEVSMDYGIEAVPTVLLLSSGKVLDQVNGVKIAELTKKVRELSQKSTLVIPPAEPAPPAQDLNTRLKALTHSAEVMLFMKGEPDEPKCGFSRSIVSLLRERNVKFATFDILSDEEVRQGLKTFSNWPTYPQVYVRGQLIGGLDIVKELIENGEFDSTFPKQQPLQERLKNLINKAPIMLFMKGDKMVQRCGFSRQVVELLNSKGAEYETFDILEDEEVRQGLKEYSNWPTYPQLYVKGQLIGGLDILKEMDSNGELEEALEVSVH